MMAFMILLSLSMLVAIHGHLAQMARSTLIVIVTESSWVKRNIHSWVSNNHAVLCITGHTKR